jgi:colicin import membrane protein
MAADRLLAVAGSVVIHLVVVGILAFTMWERPEPSKVVTHKPIIQARAVDEATAMAPVRRREAEEQRKRDEAERKRKAAEAEKRRKVEEQRKRVAAEKKRKAEVQHKKAEAEKKRQAELKRKKAEAEKKRLAEELRQKEEAERKRKEQEDLERRKAELQRQMDIEAERLAAEERARYSRQLATDTNLYKTLVEQHIGRHWIRPTGSPKAFTCKVLVKQIPNGEVVDVRVVESCGSMVLDRSVETAVRKASPLPLPENRDVFDRELVITFIPSDRN